MQMALYPLLLFSQFGNDYPFEVVLLLDHLVEAQQILTLYDLLLMEDHLVLQNNI
jgi:hypothetical protein